MVFRNTNKGLTILMYQTFFAKNLTDEYLRYRSDTSNIVLNLYILCKKFKWTCVCARGRSTCG